MVTELCRPVNLRTESYDVYIGRAGQGQDGYFGNPYAMGHRCSRCREPHPTPGSTLDCYRAYFAERVEKDPEFRRRVLELRGKRLGCFCKPKPCHGDIIAEFVNDWASR